MLEKNCKVLIVYKLDIKICVLKECINHQLKNINTIHDLAMLNGTKVHVLLGNITKSMQTNNEWLTHSQVPGWTHLRIHQSVVAESWDSEGAPGFQL